MSLLVCCHLVGVWAFYTIKPITDRPNISISDLYEERKDFSKDQKSITKSQKNECKKER